ncbi:MAG: hypothetical protein KGO96_00715 [Elusimicrobia bacterium]|nr:hypothetical protein [Elusimicrobiota bacterium]MDE2236322.1 hypothetical protein [Elusimicrobiota bacterium]MDE2424416.1 hypothetical protein [Elusimicrobiota bacterium]
MSARLASAGLLSALLLSACGGGKPVSIAKVEDVPELASAALTTMPEQVPAYGIALDGGTAPGFEVTIEAGDSALVHPGQRAFAYVLPSTAPVACRVTRILRGVSAETGQSIAWLAPVARGLVAPNDFVSARITVAVRRGVLTVPAAAVMVRDGKTMVVRQAKGPDGKVYYQAVPVKTGMAAGGRLEIVSGLKPGERVAVSGAVGLLNPDFKALAD